MRLPREVWADSTSLPSVTLTRRLSKVSSRSLPLADWVVELTVVVA